MDNRFIFLGKANDVIALNLRYVIRISNPIYNPIKALSKRL